MLRDDAEAEDVAQEALLRLWRSADGLEVGPQGLRVLTIQHHERRAPGLSQRSAHGGGRQLQALCQQLGRDLKTRQQAGHRTCPGLNRLPGCRLIRGRRREVGLLPPVAQW